MTAQTSATAPATIQDIHSLRDFRVAAAKETKGFQWPTLVFSTLVITMTVASTALALAGYIPLWLGMIFNAFWMTQGYTAAHECAHWNLNGKHRKLRWLNEVVGTAGFIFTMYSFTVHAHIHRLHHAHTNDPERDADCWVSRAPNLFSAILRAYTFYFYTQYFTFKVFPLVHDKKRFAIRAIIETAIPVTIAITLAAMGFWKEVLLLWFIPTLSAFAGVSFFVDWIPHRNADKTDTMKSSLIMVPTDSLKGRLFCWAFNFHNYHLVHHLTPSVPWYAQEPMFRRSENFLKESGARISYAH